MLRIHQEQYNQIQKLVEELSNWQKRYNEQNTRLGGAQKTAAYWRKQYDEVIIRINLLKEAVESNLGSDERIRNLLKKA